MPMQLKKGAEAVVRDIFFISRKAVAKERISKNYRLKEIDELLRRSRTKAEARLLHKAKLAGVPCPTVLCVEDFLIIMSRLPGNRPKMTKRQTRLAGDYLARLHNNGIIHGDYTPANLLADRKNLYVIDFGLGFFSKDIEDMAVDVFTMLKSLGKKNKNYFLEGYKQCKNYKSVLKRLEEISKRMRYAN